MRSRSIVSLVLALVPTIVGCGRSLQAPAAVELVDHRRVAASPALAQARVRADRSPDDFELSFDAGMGHMWSTLEGNLEHRDLAEQYLERAWRADPAAQPIARVLARFLNMRSTALDLSRIDLQIELYESVVSAPADPIEAGRDEFMFDCFLEAARAMRDYEEGHELAAYVRVTRLERRLAARLRHHPDEIDTHAMAGNYALGFAGALPWGKRQRLARGIEHLRVQQARWEELSPGARAEYMAPNVREVWTFMLAEALTAKGEIDEARVHYARVVEAERVGSPPRIALADASRERLSRLPEYAGRAELLPVWPAGPASCMACHSETARLPTDGLFVLEARG